MVDLDLDRSLPAGTPPPNRPAHPVLVGVVVLGLLAGALLRTAAQPPPAPQPPRTVASAALVEVLLTPQPSVAVEIRLTNRSSVRQVADTAAVSGGGVQTTQAALGIDLPPGQDGVATARVPLRCGPGQHANEPVRIVVRMRVAGSGPPVPPTDVPAVPVGRVADAGGLCAAADSVLPAGWREQVRVTRWTLAGGRLTLNVIDLPPDVSEILAVQADSWLLPWTDAPAVVRDRGAELRLDPPSPGCQDGGTRPVLPTGLQLVLPSAGGIRPVYAPIGAAVAQWLADAFTWSCPGRPDGPAAVRTGLEL